MRRLAVLIAVIVVALPAASAVAAGVYFVGAVSVGPVKAPRFLSLTADGTLEVSSVHWSRWGGSVALGRGQAEYHGCTPSCAAAKPHYARVTVKLSRIRVCSGRRYYSTVTLILRSGKHLDARYLKRSWAPC